MVQQNFARPNATSPELEASLPSAFVQHTNVVFPTVVSVLPLPSKVYSEPISVCTPVNDLKQHRPENSEAPLGFSGGFGKLSRVQDSEEDLSHPPGFSDPCHSNFGGNQNISDASFNNQSFLIELKKTMDMGESMGYVMEGCFERVKEIIEGHGMCINNP